MKKLNVITILVVICYSFTISACVAQSSTLAKDGDVVIISTAGMQIEEGATLADFMQRIKGSKSLTSFTFKDGMLVEINGLKAVGNVYWMLYTDDVERGNAEWGSYTLPDLNQTFNSAVLGAEALPIVPNCTYVWVAQAF